MQKHPLLSSQEVTSCLFLTTAGTGSSPHAQTSHIPAGLLCLVGEPSEQGKLCSLPFLCVTLNSALWQNSNKAVLTLHPTVAARHTARELSCVLVGPGPSPVDVLLCPVGSARTELNSAVGELCGGVGSRPTCWYWCQNHTFPAPNSPLAPEGL